MHQQYFHNNLLKFLVRYKPTSLSACLLCTKEPFFLSELVNVVTDMERIGNQICLILKENDWSTKNSLTKLLYRKKKCIANNNLVMDTKCKICIETIQYNFNTTLSWGLMKSPLKTYIKKIL